MPQAEKPSRTAQILETSLQLFNERGVHDVSAHDVARTLGISPGNLTYHYKKKNDIVNGLVDELEQALSN